MSDTNKKTDQEKGDEVLKRMLKTPPKPKEKQNESRENSRQGLTKHQKGGNVET